MGRAFLIRLQHDTRADAASLEKEHPGLAKRFKHLHDELDVPHLSSLLDGPRSQYDPASQIIHRQAVVEQFNSTVNEIRALNGFERYLLPPAENELMALATRGPIVVLNFGDERGDAFLVTTQNIRVLSLPKLRGDDLFQKAWGLTDTLNDLSTVTYRKVNAQLRDVPKWLWDVAVGPVLDELGFTETPEPGQVWPHVWWIPTGLFS